MARSLESKPGSRTGCAGGWLQAALLALLPASAPAVTWDYVPSLSAGAGYETNPGGTSNSDQEDDGYVTSGTASLNITGETGTTRISSRPELQGAIYSGTDDQYRDDSYLNYILPVTVSESWQRALGSFSGGYSRISTRDSIVVGFDPNNPPRPGIDTTNRRTEYQERWYLAPSFRYQVTPRDIVGLSINYDDVTYTEAEFSFRTDYIASSADLSWDRSLSPQSTVSLSANVSGFEATRPGSPVENDTLTYGLSAGYQFALTPTATLGLTAGASRSEVKIKGLAFITTPIGPLPCLDPVQNTFVLCTMEGTDDNFLGQIYYRQRAGDSITTELRLSRSIEPNSDGSQVTLDQVSAFLTKDFSRLLYARLGARFSKQDAVVSRGGALSNRFNRDYYTVEASLTRRLNRSWSLRAQYTFTDDKQTQGFTYSVSNHRLYLYLQYTGLGSH